MPSSKYTGIIADIQRRIASGALAPGDRIFSIREMCDAYKVSSIVCLRVFKELSEAGVIEKRDGEGYYVLPAGGAAGGNSVVCAFRPLREFSQTENFGNRIIYGIMNEALGHHKHLIFPESAMRLRAHIPTDDEVRLIADEVFALPNVGAVMLDMRITDEAIRRHFIPRAGSIPLVVVGRHTKAPVQSVYVPMEAIGTELGALVRRTIASAFIVLPESEAATFSESRLMTAAFLKAVGAAEETVFQSRELMAVSVEKDREIADLAAAHIRNVLGKSFVLCGSDMFAKCFAELMEARGLIAGRDYMLMGFGGMECAANHRPPLATVEVAISELGSEAVKLAFDAPRTASKSVSYAFRLNSTF